MTQRYEAVITADQPVIESETRRPVPFPEYVTQYSRMQRGNAFMTVGGLIAAVAGVLYVDGLPGELLTLAGIGLGIVGVFSVAVAWEAHRRYGDEFAISRITHYRKPETTVRPFNPSRNGRTIRVGRFSLPVATWEKLHDAAVANGGRITRDVATGIIPRDLYRGWGDTAGELQRMALIDDDGRIIPAAWAQLLRDEHPPAPAVQGNENDAWHARTAHARRES